MQWWRRRIRWRGRHYHLDSIIIHDNCVYNFPKSSFYYIIIYYFIPICRYLLLFLMLLLVWYCQVTIVTKPQQFLSAAACFTISNWCYPKARTIGVLVAATVDKQFCTIWNLLFSIVCSHCVLDLWFHCKREQLKNRRLIILIREHVSILYAYACT